MECSRIISYLEELAPVKLAESWDNVGLLLGSRGGDVRSILVCLDVTPEVVEEAIIKGASLIVSHHPFIFKGLKRISSDDVKQKMIYDLIQNNIAVYSMHTNFDCAESGLNFCLAEKLGLTKITGLKKYKEEDLCKIVVFVPVDSVDKVRLVLGEAGVGWIGKYSNCTFSSKGTGSFKPQAGATPYIGEIGKMEYVEEYRLETIIQRDKLNYVIQKMIEAHPYEEVAYDIYSVENNAKEYSLGNVGELDENVGLDGLIDKVKEVLKLECLRVVGRENYGNSKKVAVFCGSFDEDFYSVLKSKASVLITGDLKYHAACDIKQSGLCVIDAGHFGTEHIFVDIVAEKLTEQFSDIIVIKSERERDVFEFV